MLVSFFNAPNVGFAVLDDHLRFRAVNDSLAVLNGIPSEAHIGKTVRDVLGNVFGDAVETIERTLTLVLASGQSVSNFEFVAKPSTRSEAGVWLHNYFPIKDVTGKVKQVGAVVVELTQEKKKAGARQSLGDRSTAEEDSAITLAANETGRLQVLLQVTDALNSNLEVQEVFPAVSSFLRQVFRHDYASVTLYDEASRELRKYCLDSTFSGALMSGLPIGSLQESAAGRAFVEKETKIYSREDLLTIPSGFLNQLLEQGVQSLCCLPLFTPKGVIGTLNLASTGDNAFLPEDTIFLKQVAAQVAAALDNARAHREIARLTEKLKKEKLFLEDHVRSDTSFEKIVGDSPALKRVLSQAQIVAPSNVTALILGETGTGKELIASAIHHLSLRKEGAFIKLNCAAIPTGLLESELFGHEKGAFTGAISRKIGRLELADRGTLFLDEVGDIPLEIQPKLLRVLQDREFERLGGIRTIKVDIRLIAATNRDLARSVAEHQFRSDLYYRLHVFPIHMPPLRERREDIPPLVRHFVHKFAGPMHKQIKDIPIEAMNALTSWEWPGNVRELENFIERSVILSDGSTLNLPLAELTSSSPSVQPDNTLEGMEKDHIIRVLRETNGVIAGLNGAAARLGIKRTTLQSKMLKLRISKREYET